MLFLSNVADFVSFNHSGIRKLTQSICIKYNVQRHLDDILQDVYKIIVKRDILHKYDPNHPSATKISTFLYKPIKNVVRAYQKSNESVIERRTCHTVNHPVQGKLMYEESEDIFPNHFKVDSNYENIILRNRVSDEVDGLSMELNLFEVYLQKRDKFYNLNKRKYPDIYTRGISLLKAFKLMRQGLTNREIASKYGVSFMFITVLKNEIKEQLMKFGLYWNEPKPRSPKKKFLSDTEIEDYAKEMRRGRPRKIK